MRTESDDGMDSIDNRKKRKVCGKKAVIKIGSDDMDDSRDTISDSDSLVEECKILCICTNLPSHMFTCALHYSKSKADRLKLLVAHMDSSEEDVEIVGREEHIQNPTCQTASRSWMNSVTDLISFVISREVTVTIDRIVPKLFDAIAPLCRHKIRGDGNCLFRAMSKFCVGTELSHNDVRHSIVAFMKLPKNCDIFARQFGFGPNLVYKSVLNYIQRTRIDKEGTFGTDTEIIVFATMIQANVKVFSCTYSNWHCYRPAFFNNSCLSSNETFSLHIIHEHLHYDLCVPPSQ